MQCFFHTLCVDRSDLRPPAHVEAPVCGPKRSRSSRQHSPSPLDSDHEDSQLTNQAELRREIAAINTNTKAILVFSKLSKIPFGLLTLLSETFQCCICVSPMKPPVLLGWCCKSILGCEECLNSWYSGTDALTKTCPLCRAERGLYRNDESDDVLKVIKCLIDGGNNSDQ